MKKDTTPLRKPIFTFLTGDVNWIDYGGKWISQRMNNGEFDFWYVIELINMDDACGRDNKGRTKYNVSLAVVSPSEAGQDKLDEATDGYQGVDFDDPRFQVECLHGYGTYAPVQNWDGNNAHKLIGLAKKEAAINASFTFGFSMDAPKNAIGTTGWDCLRGDILAGLYKGEQTPAKPLMRKLQSVN